jgi:hypothetical protein
VGKVAKLLYKSCFDPAASPPTAALAVREQLALPAPTHLSPLTVKAATRLGKNVLAAEGAAAIGRGVLVGEATLGDMLLAAWCVKLVAELHRARGMERAAHLFAEIILDPEATPVERAQGAYQLKVALHENRRRRYPR